VWRKIKHLGAILLHDSAWVLPATPRSREQFQWLAAEIVELGGEATVCTAEIESASQQRELAKQFSTSVDALYRDILAQLKRKNADLASLSRKYQAAASQDYFQSKFGNKVRAALLAKGERST
jgi:hypothetical protein